MDQEHGGSIVSTNVQGVANASPAGHQPVGGAFISQVVTDIGIPEGRTGIVDKECGITHRTDIGRQFVCVKVDRIQSDKRAGAASPEIHLVGIDTVSRGIGSQKPDGCMPVLYSPVGGPFVMQIGIIGDFKPLPVIDGCRNIAFPGESIAEGDHIVDRTVPGDKAPGMCKNDGRPFRQGIVLRLIEIHNEVLRGDQGFIHIG